MKTLRNNLITTDKQCSELFLISCRELFTLSIKYLYANNPCRFQEKTNPARQITQAMKSLRPICPRNCMTNERKKVAKENKNRKLTLG